MADPAQKRVKGVLIVMWLEDERGARLFAGGQEAFAAAAFAAHACTCFTPDVDEEMVADEECSCYNCRYRRWTAASFTCVHNAR